jgi:hypothetical protein
VADLVQGYTNVIALCYTNNGGTWSLKTTLSASDRYCLATFANSYALRTYPDRVLNALAVASSQAEGTECVYHAALTNMKLNVPFEHQTYAGMYDLFNYITGLRATAL